MRIVLPLAFCFLLFATTLGSGLRYPSISAASAKVAELMGRRSPGARAAGAISDKRPLPRRARLSFPALPVGDWPDRAAIIPEQPSPIVPLGNPVVPVEEGPIKAFNLLIPEEAPETLPPLFEPPPVVTPIVIGPRTPDGPGGPPAAPPPVVPVVPEPATWLSMLVGFGLLGAFMRMRRRPSARAQVSSRR